MNPAMVQSWGLKPVASPNMNGLVSASLVDNKITFLDHPEWAATYCASQKVNLSGR